MAEDERNSIILPREVAQNECLDLKQLFLQLQWKQSWIKAKEYKNTKLVACSKRSVSWSIKQKHACVDLTNNYS